MGNALIAFDAVLPVRLCENCGHEMHRRDRERLTRWERRRFCSYDCSNGAKRNGLSAAKIVEEPRPVREKGVSPEQFASAALLSRIMACYEQVMVERGLSHWTEAAVLLGASA